MGDEDTVAVVKSAPQAQTVESYEEALRKEWSTYVAVEPIFVNGVRAHNAGDAVPAANVEAHGWEAQGLVRKA
jgi:hypothetical protein